MPQQIDVPGMGIVEFPDGMTDDQISAAIKNNMPSTQKAVNASSPSNGFLADVANNVDKNVIQPVEATGRFARDFGEGLSQGVLNIPSGIHDTAALVPNLFGANIKNWPRFNYAPQNTASSLGEIAPFFMGGALSKAADAIGLAEKASKIPQVANAIQQASKIMKEYPASSSILKNAAIAGVFSPQGATGFGALLGGGLGAVPATLGAGKNFLLKRYGGDLTPEELEKALQVTQGTQTPLGDVIQSPGIKKFYENVVGRMPFSGVGQTLMENARNITDKGNSLLDSLVGNIDPADYSGYLENNLQSSYKQSLKQKNSLYKNVENLSNENEVAKDIPLENTVNTINKFKEAMGNTSILNEHPETRETLSKLGLFLPRTENAPATLSSFPENVQKTLKNIPKEDWPDFLKAINYKGETSSQRNVPVSFGEAAQLKGRLNNFIAQLRGSSDSNDRHRIGALIELRKSLTSDLSNAKNMSGMEDVKNAYDKAENFYANDFSRYLDPKIYRFASGTAPEGDQLVPSFLKSGGNDRADLLRKLTDVLSPEDVKLLGYSHLQKAITEEGLNPQTLARLMSRRSLGNRQFETLFPEKDVRDKLRDYASLVKKNSESFNQMNNPQTGFRMNDLAALSSLGSLGAAGHHFGGPLGAAIWPSAVVGAGRLLNRAFTSERARNYIVRELQKQKSSAKPFIGLPDLSSLSGG